MNRWVLLYILFLPLVIFSQDGGVLNGKVAVGENPISNIYVINATTGTETRTGVTGNFSITAQVGDRLVFYSPSIITREFILKEESFKQQPFVVTVTLQAYELNEVVLDKYGAIDEESLGLVPKGQKQYTPAERRLKTAGDFKPIHLLGILGGSLPLDPIINAINGRTKMLKKELETERKEQVLEMTDNLYDDEVQITAEYKIPKEYVKGFLYYCVENEDFSGALKAKNDKQVKFLMHVLAEKYLVQLTKED
ncbi:hypothetical protein DVK85_08230 [Flavobacterium arcticum]|uniref:Carboxypeptidase regulatory-like domain-containing protein n=1 Tax=Flavobacterium arcticum TaxID=1784713 RepID=A0A345HCB6_9FLAO|nr:hypothetical protein [Flavobacterium arcticum]AXG74226.1 hypothetical protein DVK85_08230 [Flavobacterium arcticum]KAF2508187.1 hypothetical protein E0W72_11070 [Flavobacterium arcticum]